MNPLYRNDRPGKLPDSWYVASSKIPELRPSLRGEIDADVAIVGAGFTGLTTALFLAEGGLKVAVIDAHRVGFGASGRNGGQVGSGFNMDQQELEKELGVETAHKLWQLSIEAKAQVRELSKKYSPEARFMPGVAHGEWTSKGVEQAKAYAEYLRENYSYESIEFLDSDAFQAICPATVYKGGSIDWDAGHIHPLRYVLGLARACEDAGVTIYDKTEAHRVTKGLVQTNHGRIKTDHIVLAGNGYLSSLHRRYAARVMPINSFIAATEPLGDLADTVLRKDVAVADDKFVVNYFRLSEDKRLLFGGRENYGIGFPRDIKTKLVERMIRLFPSLSSTKVDYVWGGTLGITTHRVPYISQLEPGILAAGGFSGHGVALTSIAGRVMAEAILGNSDRFDVMAKLPVPAFPGGSAARAPLLTFAMTWYAARDRFGI